MNDYQSLTPEELARISCNPQRSVIIEACAGSGKTWQLVSRIFRLLLSGVKPQEILAITFTRKAAQEMKARLEGFLQSLQKLSEEDLKRELKNRGVEDRHISELLPKARGLFEEVLSNPRKISIDTFHGWFSRICQVAPIGVGVPQGASLREDVRRLLDDALSGWWSELGEGKAEFAQLKNYYQYLLENLSAKAVDQMLVGSGGIVHQRAAWMRFSEFCKKSGLTPLEKIKARLPLVEAEDPLKKAIRENAHWNELSTIALLMQACGAPNDMKYGTFIMQGCESFNDGESLDSVAKKIHSGFLTAENKIYSKYEKCSTGLEKYLKTTGNDDWLHKLPEIRMFWGQILLDRIEWVKQNKLYLINQAWIALGEAMIKRYQEVKEFNRSQDFSDLEWHASRLMEDESSAAYLQARLDARYKHILIDEFQDTNPLQWQILQGWLAAYGKNDNPPNIFIVGDPKQSIYRFRGADARLFDEVKTFLTKNFNAELLYLDRTRRNSPGVLHGVNEVFSPLAKLGYPFRPQKTLWESTDASIGSGGTYLIPLVPYEETVAQTDERAALHKGVSERNNVVPSKQRYEEALQVAKLIKNFMGNKTVLDERDGKQFSRPAQWGDFLVLIKRKRYLPEIERAFRKLGLPCDSPRQGGLLKTLEADDLVCLLEILLTPGNNFALAQVLRSPIFGIGEANLQLIASQSMRESQTWWQCLITSEVSELKHAFTKIEAWMKLSQHLPVHDLLDHIYADGEVRLRYANFSPSLERDRVLANLDAFLSLALEVDGGRYPSLSRFIEELRFLKSGYEEESPDEGESIDSDNDGLDSEEVNIGNSGAVRLMTIHSAKGLEAPFVFILDANTDPIKADSSGIILDWDPKESSPNLICVYNSALITAGIESALEKESKIAEQESRNLLYVAMTRAKQELYVSGVAGKSKTEEANLSNKNSWYGHLESVGVQKITIEDASKVGGEAIIVGGPPTHLEEGSQEFNFLDFGRGIWRAPADFKTDRSDDEVASELDFESLELGTVLHSILEHLTSQNGGGQAYSIERIDARRLSSWLNVPITRVQEALRIANNILSSQSLKKFFDSNSYVQAWNELDLLDEKRRLFRIDRLVEFNDHLMILDYKLSVPGSDEDLFKQYLAQINNYASLVRDLRPDKTVKAGFIDQTGRLIEVGGV